MTYQVSDSTLRDRGIRHSLVSYLFGGIIIAAGIDLVAGLIE